MMFTRRTRIAGLAIGLVLMPEGHAQESFRVELGRDGETIGDMRPVFLPFESRPLPAISPAEVARRYHRLFQNSDEPEVRIDALNRLSNIRDRAGEDVGFSLAEEAQVYRQAINSYESILARGVYSGRLDELLYQMAKAHALTGQPASSIERLEQLVGLYPDSPLVPEARFRLAEHAFAAGQYVQAEAGYRQVIGAEGDAGLSGKARYMMGWSQYKQGVGAWDRSAQSFIEVLDALLPDAGSLARVSESSVDIIDDTFRILALMAARKQGPDTLVSWLQDGAGRPWEHLMFDRLADYYAVTGDTRASVATHEAFLTHAPDHPAIPAFLLQMVEVWQRDGNAERVRAAQAEFIGRYSADSAFPGLAPAHQAHWRAFSRSLADYYYAVGSRTFGQGDDATARDAFARAAGFYEGLAGRIDAPGEVLRLAGDARLQAGQFQQALADFRRAAYQAPGYEEAADAGWAAVTIVRDGLDGRVESADFSPGLATLSAEAERFMAEFPGDSRSNGLLADLGTRWFAAGDHTRALDYSARVITGRAASPANRLAAWQITARIRQQNQAFGLAERAWAQALELAELPETSPATGNDSPDPAEIRRQLATVVYRQGEQAATQGRVDEAVRHFRRVDSVLPGSEIAIKARYDAANTLLRASAWSEAVNDLEAFRRDYPQHGLAGEISEKLVLAWTSSGDYTRAASELLQAAGSQPDPWPYRLRAAELLHKGGHLIERNELYRDYLATEPEPSDGQQHQHLQTLRHRLADAGQGGDQWREALVTAELASPWHSEQSLEWAARASLVLGARDAATFTSIALEHPLERSLARKQKALEQARRRFLDAESLGGEQVRSESLFRRAELYRGLANDLMVSSVPAELNEMEAMQYQMLLEEEAFPFEEKAIQLHTENHRRITDAGYDAWIGRSLGVLAELHPGRYQRRVKWLSWTMEVADGV